jgi:hypothetical protein
MLFLITNAGFFWYASYVLANLVMSEAFEKNYFNAYFYNPRTNHRVKATTFSVLKYIVEHNLILSCLFLLAVVMGLAVTLFFGYHCSLILQGITTNETFKYGDITEIYEKLLNSHQKYLSIRSQNEEQRDNIQNADRRGFKIYYYMLK